MIRITSTLDGFRRGGIAHPKGTSEYPNATFTKEQLKQITAEPLLSIEIVKDQAQLQAKNKNASDVSGQGDTLPAGADGDNQ